MLVLITDIAIKAPKKYEPPSPRKRVALGKLYIRKIITIRIPHNIKRAKSLFPLKWLIKNKFVKMIKVCIPNNPLYPSIKLLPFIINRKHKQTKNNEKSKIDISQIIRDHKKIISIFPGSRQSELDVLFPILIDFIKLMNKRHNDFYFYFHSTDENKNLILSEIKKSNIAKMNEFIPNRLKFFDEMNFNMYPYKISK